LVAEQELRPEALQLRFLRLRHPVQDGVFFPFEHLQFDLIVGDFGFVFGFCFNGGFLSS
uniref:Uncharacterized protein n=1 Tax=Xiphophorus couchianus TaxID=32473 RepID=A0A3B5MXU9_9TELE